MHLVYLGLTHTEQHLDEHLAWATRDRPGATALLEHVLAAEVDAKSEKRLVGRIRTSGLVERKTLEGFDWNFQPSLDEGLVLGDATIAAAILPPCHARDPHRHRRPELPPACRERARRQGSAGRRVTRAKRPPARPLPPRVTELVTAPELAAI